VAQQSTGASVQSAHAAEKSAAAAQQNVALSKIALDATIVRDRLDQRAWVGVGKVVVPKLEVGKEASFGVTIVNSGKTPALKARAHLTTHFFDVEKEKQFVPVPLTNPPRKSETILDPGIDMRIGQLNPTHKLGKEVVDGIKKKTVIVYLFGKISYWDIFNRPYCRRFCRYLSSDLNTASGCDTYNEEVEGECKEEQG
jgi:hypothetical protein